MGAVYRCGLNEVVPNKNKKTYTSTQLLKMHRISETRYIWVRQLKVIHITHKQHNTKEELAGRGL